MTFRVTMVVELRATYGRPIRQTVVTRFAGCKDTDDAKRKARATYNVVAFKKVEPVE